MKKNGELVDFERGSTFGGIVTMMVFVGFIYLILNDLSNNINNLPYTFEVRDKYLSPKEQRERVVNLGEYDKSADFIIGFAVFDQNVEIDTTFDPLDNDYIEVLTSYWDTAKNLEEGKPWVYLREGPQLELCSE